jgi:hypothetical protein
MVSGKLVWFQLRVVSLKCRRWETTYEKHRSSRRSILLARNQLRSIHDQQSRSLRLFLKHQWQTGNVEEYEWAAIVTLDSSGEANWKFRARAVADSKLEMAPSFVDLMIGY